jgi:hypothetical protein
MEHMLYLKQRGLREQSHRRSPAAQKACANEAAGTRPRHGNGSAYHMLTHMNVAAFRTMDKAKLLFRLTETRDRAEKAYLNVVLLTLELTELKAKGGSTNVAEIRLRQAANEEQKRLREMNWVLDQLDDTKR